MTASSFERGTAVLKRSWTNWNRCDMFAANLWSQGSDFLGAPYYPYGQILVITFAWLRWQAKKRTRGGRAVFLAPVSPSLRFMRFGKRQPTDQVWRWSFQIRSSCGKSRLFFSWRHLEVTRTSLPQSLWWHTMRCRFQCRTDFFYLLLVTSRLYMVTRHKLHPESQ